MDTRNPNAKPRPRTAIVPIASFASFATIASIALMAALLTAAQPAGAQTADGGKVDAADAGPKPRTYGRAASAVQAARPPASSASTPLLVFHPPRIVITLVADQADREALRAKLAAASGLKVRDLRAIDSRHVALNLVCPDAVSCDEATNKLRAASDLVADLRVDRMRTVPHRPAPDATR